MFRLLEYLLAASDLDQQWCHGLSNENIGSRIHGFDGAGPYGHTQDPSNPGSDPLNNSQVKQNVDDEGEEINDTQTAKDDHTGHAFRRIDLLADIVGQTIVVQGIRVENLLMDQVAKDKA